MKKFINRRIRTRGTISANIIVRNQEKNIKRAIISIRDLVDEIIVIDTGSTDGTISAAVFEGAQVWEKEWEDDFAVSRNVALEKSRKEWILSLDADEVIPKRGREEIIEMTKYKEVAAWRMATWNYKQEQRMLDIKTNTGYYEEGKGYKYFTVSIKTRLFQKRPGVCWEFPIHEVVDKRIAAMGGKFAAAKIAVQHLHGEETKEEVERKTKMYHRLAEKKVKKYPEMGHAWSELAVCEMVERQYLKALRSYYNAITRGEDTANNRYGYAGVLKILGHKEKGEKEIERGLCCDFPNLTTIE